MLNKRISPVMCALAISLVAIMLIASIEVVGAVDPSLSNSGGGNWQFSREITISEKSGNTLTDYQVLLQLSGSYFPTTTSDGADIRFTDISGNELSYLIEKWDYPGNSASIWVKVPSIPANGKSTIKMYYGNPSATTISNVKTFIREIDGVVGSWHFDEGSRSVLKDSSGNGNDGRIYGATWVDGKYGKALSFDGVDDYVEVSADSTLHLTSALTVEVWILVNDIPSVQAPILFKGSNNYGRTYNYRINIRDEIFNMGICSPSNEYWWYSNTKIILGEWMHLVLTSDGTTAKFFVDGNYDSKKTAIAPYGDFSMHPLIINWNEKPVNCIIDEVRIYKRALSDKDVLDLYNNYGYTTKNDPGKVLVRKYAFTEPTITLGNEKKLESEQPTEATVPNKPQNLKATAGDDYITLRWEATSDNGISSITSYKIYRGTTSGKELPFEEVDNLSDYKDKDVTNGQTYYYRVSAINSEGEGAKSNEVSATPTPTTSPVDEGIIQTTKPENDELPENDKLSENDKLPENDELPENDKLPENTTLLELMGVILIVSGLLFTAVTSIKKDVSIEFGVSERNLKYVGGTGILLVIIGACILLKCNHLI